MGSMSPLMRRAFWNEHIALTGKGRNGIEEYRASAGLSGRSGSEGLSSII